MGKEVAETRTRVDRCLHNAVRNLTVSELKIIQAALRRDTDARQDTIELRSVFDTAIMSKGGKVIKEVTYA